MSFRLQAATLALLTLTAVAPTSARAQFGNLSRFAPAVQPQTTRPPMYVAQDTRPPQPTLAEGGGQYPGMSVAPMMEQQSRMSLDVLAPGERSPGGTHLDGGYVVEGDMSDYGGEYYAGGYGAESCDTCGNYGGAGSCLCPPGLMGGSRRGRFFATADYLYVRASFSEATAYVIHNPDNAPEFFDEFHDLDFQYESSFRVGGGYELSCCDEQIRFMFTRFSSFAQAFTDDENAIGPFETSPGPGGTLDVYADVDAKSYDLEYAKTLRLGGQMSCACGDPCGCSTGDPCGSGSCGPCCPEWAVTWSGGLRFADVDWTRSYFSQNPQVQESRDALSTMDFQGGGPRFGLEGRRYFGPGLCGSIFLKGDISLLLGDVNLREQRIVSDLGTSATPDTVQTQTATFRNLIPVTEIETGMTVQMIEGLSFTSGYLWSAWHDLGFRDQFDFGTFLETSYDDANILGFDGFFARLEARY